MNLASYKKILIICLSLLLLTSSYAYTHGDLTIRINQKTEEISKNPNNSSLYFERGFLYQQHEDYNLALKDYNQAESLGLTGKLLQYRKAEAHYLIKSYTKALKYIEACYNLDSKDIKIHKLKAQILFELKEYNKALKSYNYVLENTIDLRPYNILEYCNILLAKDMDNYKEAIETLNFGLNKIGTHTFSLQLKKLDYLESSNQITEAVEQYNYFILNNNRKEYWYYKKAKYLFENKNYQDSNIALQQAKIAINLLDRSFKKTSSNKKLLANIKQLEINLSKS